jgi:hypothetical protein
MNNVILKKTVEEIALEWANDFLSTGYFASYYGFTTSSVATKLIVLCQKEYHKCIHATYMPRVEEILNLICPPFSNERNNIRIRWTDQSFYDWYEFLINEITPEIK